MNVVTSQRHREHRSTNAVASRHSSVNMNKYVYILSLCLSFLLYVFLSLFSFLSFFLSFFVSFFLSFFLFFSFLSVFEWMKCLKLLMSHIMYWDETIKYCNCNCNWRKRRCIRPRCSYAIAALFAILFRSVRSYYDQGASAATRIFGHWNPWRFCYALTVLLWLWLCPNCAYSTL